MNREIIIGRSSDLDMVLVEDMVSRRHAKISSTDAEVYIQDMGSTNGTFVGGRRCQSGRSDGQHQGAKQGREDMLAHGFQRTPVESWIELGRYHPHASHAPQAARVSTKC